MTDRELLELAAKAAGVEFYTPGGLDGPWFEILSDRGFYLRGCVPWNPLTADGDALRLAVKLRITVELTARTVMAQEDGTSGEKAILDLLGDAPYAATRRAIVRAAAEIGKAMP